jgi:hypothetical protein
MREIQRERERERERENKREREGRQNVLYIVAKRKLMEAICAENVIFHDRRFLRLESLTYALLSLSLSLSLPLSYPRFHPSFNLLLLFDIII